jgi:hypothetical protein
LMAV